MVHAQALVQPGLGKPHLRYDTFSNFLVPAHLTERKEVRMGEFLYALWSFLQERKAFWLVVAIGVFLVLLGSLLYFTAR